MTWTWRRGMLRRQEGVACVATGTTAPSRVVLKIGGSLLSLPGWPQACLTLLAAIGRPAVVVVGGGGVVDGLRVVDAAGGLPPEASHRLAIDALRITATAVAVATGLPLGDRPERDNRVMVLDTPSWLGHGRRSEMVPIGWHVTSDSIAAVVAVTLHCPLVLCKCVEPPAGDGDLCSLAASGWVDPHFAEAAAALERIEWAVPYARATDGIPVRDGTTPDSWSP